jgi:hypothetical protein
MMITYTCICTTLTAYVMTGYSVYIDQSEWRAVYTAPGGDFNAQRIA